MTETEFKGEMDKAVRESYDVEKIVNVTFQEVSKAFKNGLK